MDYRRIIQDCIDFIDANIQEPLDIAALAKRCGFSHYHFYRVFQSFVGCPIGEYIRRRRLAYAAVELQSGRRLIDIAQDFGFETHAGFTKSFRKVYGSSPDRYRRHAIHPPPCRLCLSEQIELRGGIVMEPKLVQLPAFAVVGYALETTDVDGENNRAIPDFWQRYMNNGWHGNLQKQPGTKADKEYGICFPTDASTGRFRYCIGLETTAVDRVDPELFSGSIPAGYYAVFTTPPTETAHFSATIQQTWQYIFQTWFPQSGYQLADGHPDFELYDERCHGDRDIVMDIYIPITKPIL